MGENVWQDPRVPPMRVCKQSIRGEAQGRVRQREQKPRAQSFPTVQIQALLHRRATPACSTPSPTLGITPIPLLRPSIKACDNEHSTARRSVNALRSDDAGSYHNQ